MSFSLSAEVGRRVREMGELMEIECAPETRLDTGMCLAVSVSEWDGHCEMST